MWFCGSAVPETRKESSGAGIAREATFKPFWFGEHISLLLLLYYLCAAESALSNANSAVWPAESAFCRCKVCTFYQAKSALSSRDQQQHAPKELQVRRPKGSFSKQKTRPPDRLSQRMSAPVQATIGTVQPHLAVSSSASVRAPTSRAHTTRPITNPAANSRRTEVTRLGNSNWQSVVSNKAARTSQTLVRRC